MKDRILSLLGTINKGIYEKETREGNGAFALADGGTGWGERDIARPAGCGQVDGGKEAEAGIQGCAIVRVSDVAFQHTRRDIRPREHQQTEGRGQIRA